MKGRRFRSQGVNAWRVDAFIQCRARMGCWRYLLINSLGQYYDESASCIEGVRGGVFVVEADGWWGGFVSLALAEPGGGEKNKICTARSEDQRVSKKPKTTKWLRATEIYRDIFQTHSNCNLAVIQLVSYSVSITNAFRLVFALLIHCWLGCCKPEI